jgi:hypothetical protein
VTLKTFTNYDKYNPKDAPDRHNRRRMEAENKKRRTKARKEYIDTVQNLVYFIKKRDPRVKAMEKHAAEQKAAELRLAAERKAEQAAEYKRAREQQQHQQQHQLSSDDEVDELVLSDEDQQTTISCSVVIVFEGVEQTHTCTGDDEKAARLSAAAKAIASLSSAKQFQSKKGKAALRGNAIAALNKLWQKNVLADKPEYMCSEAESSAVATAATSVGFDEDDHCQDQGMEDRAGGADLAADGLVRDRDGNSDGDDVGEDADAAQRLREDEVEQRMLGMTQKERKKFKKDMEKQNRRRQAWSEPELEPELVPQSHSHDEGSDTGADGQAMVGDEDFSAAADKRRARVDRLQAATEADTNTASRLDRQPTQEDEDAVPVCTCASCVEGGKCINDMTDKEKKKFDKVQAAAEKARLWREEHGQEEVGDGQDEDPVAPTKKEKKKKKLAKVEKKGDRKRAGRMKT